MNKVLKVILIIVGIIVAILVAMWVYAALIVKNTMDDAQLSAFKSEVNLTVSSINNYCAVEAMKEQMGYIKEPICITSDSIKSNMDKIHKIPEGYELIELESYKGVVDSIVMKYKNVTAIYEYKDGRGTVTVK